MAPVRGRDTGPQPDDSILQCHGRSALMVVVRANGTRSPRSTLQHCIHAVQTNTIDTMGACLPAGQPSAPLVGVDFPLKNKVEGLSPSTPWID